LFLGTLRENLDLARQDGFSSNQDLIAALKRFGLEQVIQNHPKGLDMPLGEDGQGLSGGQKQIIALARLTLRQPKVVLLDEPTTGLDQATEQKALQALGQWCKDKTLLVVTHRMQVLSIVDRIVVVDQGKVVMDGPRDAVLKKLAQNEQQARMPAQRVIRPSIAASTATECAAEPANDPQNASGTGNPAAT
jgi:ATP-binding cassette subfamily C protein LapB